MGHDHAHGHEGGTKGRAFAIGVGLNTAFVIVEAVYGYVAHSMALVADAAHNLTDVLGLLLAWGATVLATRRPSRTFTYGLRRSTILAALANAVLLLITIGGVAWEAIGRLRAPERVEGGTVMAVAAVGVVINAASALLFLRDREHDANVRGAFLHLASDAAVSVGVVIAGGVVLKTGWMWVDPAVSLAVSIVILRGTWGLLRQASSLALDAVPPHIDPDAVRAHLASLPGVIEVHDLHIWSMSTTEVALTAHLVMPWSSCPPMFLGGLERDLHARFDIDHATVQIEPDDAPRECKQAADGVV